MELSPVVPCAYCENPLICESCREPYRPPTSEHYQALSRPDYRILCEACKGVLVCHWCKTPYDGGDDPESEE